jgi:catabolite regulation protein CreA
MHSLQKMWLQIVDDASAISCKQTGQMNFGSFGTSSTVTGGGGDTMDCSF